MSSELERKSWSVLSDRGCEASGLTHEEARKLVHHLGGDGRHGLCIITDDAAGRMITGGLNKKSDVNINRT